MHALATIQIGRQPTEAETFVPRPKGKRVLRRVRMGPVEVIERALSAGESADRRSEARGQTSRLTNLIGDPVHGFRLQDMMHHRARRNRDLPEAVALHRARYLALDVAGARCTGSRHSSAELCENPRPGRGYGEKRVMCALDRNDAGSHSKPRRALRQGRGLITDRSRTRRSHWSTLRIG